ncbi:hypothetical protein [Paraburkholderia lacunae]|uniref:Cell wall anchor protein n=1 Tax=Paraburkholderia lacunae TaxID=2211104 RepID=A0A370MZ67_9BURK|nr:hypothetical protein [Paraburkholderia lacunae]RDJ98616.1 hypothetical protein DLM46_32580 [Paraburkholderia lacunae]
MKFTTIALSTCVLALSACGGGGNSTSTAGGAAGQTISGVAATGLPLPAATVNATCASGSGTATTAADGSYSVTIKGASLPCVLTATSSDSKVILHSVVPGAGSSSSKATAHITPLTELLVAQLSGQDPAQFASAFGPTTAVSAAALTSAQSALISVLKSAGVDPSSIGDFIGGTISAGSHQGYDAILDTLQSTITSAGTSLSELSTAVANSTSSTTAAASTLSTILAPANPDCTALKSGDHRLIKLSDGSTKQVTVDSVKLTVAMNGSSYQLTRNATCDFSLNDPGSTRVLVAKSGLASWTNGSGATGTSSLSMPAQTIDPSVINGGYNFAFFSGSQQNLFGTHNYLKGVTTAATNCPNGYGSCAVDNVTPYGHLVATPDGGADWIDDGSQAGTAQFHAVGFRNAQGNILWFATVLASGGGAGVFVPQTTLSLPAVGTTSAFWQSTVSSTGLSAVTEDSHTITAQSGTAVTRTFADSHTDVVSYNDPFGGMRHRAANTCTTTAGAATTCKSVLQLPLGGMTLAWFGSASTYGVSISVNKSGSN